jgi:hypothetical protein
MPHHDWLQAVHAAGLSPSEKLVAQTLLAAQELVREAIDESFPVRPKWFENWSIDEIIRFVREKKPPVEYEG